jgi:hypothetical protein
LLALSRWRALNQWLADLVGVGDPALALILVAGGVFLIVIYRLSIRISGLRDSNVQLAQRLAILQLRQEMSDENKKGAADK